MNPTAQKASWLTYTSQAGNFTLNYPSSWAINTSIGGPVYGDGSVISLTNNSSDGNFGLDIHITDQSQTINQGAIFNWGMVTTAANGIPIWQENANAPYTNFPGSTSCPRIAIGTDNSLSMQLKNGKYLSVYGSFCGAQNILAKTSYQDQVNSQTWKDAITILTSIKFN